MVPFHIPGRKGAGSGGLKKTDGQTVCVRPLDRLQESAAKRRCVKKADSKVVFLFHFASANRSVSASSSCSAMTGDPAGAGSVGFFSRNGVRKAAAVSSVTRGRSR